MQQCSVHFSAAYNYSKADEHLHKYSWFHKKGTFSVHSFNEDYLSIPERPGSYKYLLKSPVVHINEKMYCTL